MKIQHELSIKATPTTVYQAVATQAGVTGWWSKDCVVGEQEGESSALKFVKEGNVVEMGFRTQTLQPNEKVVWVCTENPNPAWLGTEIITEISAAPGGSKLVFSHAKFDEKWKGQDPFEMTKQGWAHFVQSLVSYCETGVGQAW